MNHLKIEYFIDSNEALLSIDNISNPIWIQIKRMIADETLDYKVISSNEVSVPWWVILSIRKGIAYHLKRYQVSLDLNEYARKELIDARKREKEYNQAFIADEILKEDLISKLNHEGFIRRLYSYQESNVIKLISIPSGATFSVPGAGKTTEALAFYAFKKDKNTKLLIVSPINAFAVWEEEIDECLPDKKIKIERLRGGIINIENILKINPQVMITNYAQFQSIEVRDAIAKHLQNYKTIMFLDESHHMKRGLQGIRGRMLLGICHLPVNKLLLTGTPMPNSPTDLIAQFNFLYPEINVSDNDIIEKIQPIYTRTTKKDLEIPDLKIQPIHIPMSPTQNKLYTLLKSEESRMIEKFLKAKQRRHLRNIGKSMMKLLQLASNPSLLASDLTFAHPNLLSNILQEGDCPKIRWICNRARNLVSNGKKVIIWSSFVKNVEILATKLSDHGAVFIHGGVNTGDEAELQTREGRIHRFKHDKECMVLVANPAACGEGISLHKVCQNAIYLDRTFNLAHYLQSIDRIHRLGLQPTQHPKVDILISSSTIDEVVNERLFYKAKRMFEVLNDQIIQPNPTIYDPEEEGIDFEDASAYAIHLLNKGEK